MSRYRGRIGFITTIETEPGVYEDAPVERYYRGDTISMGVKYQGTEHVNDNLTLNVRISVVADSFGLENLSYMRYVEYKGAFWSIQAVDDSARPRIILTLGGVWNGNQVRTSGGA